MITALRELRMAFEDDHFTLRLLVYSSSEQLMIFRQQIANNLSIHFLLDF